MPETIISERKYMISTVLCIQQSSIVENSFSIPSAITAAKLSVAKKFHWR